MLRTARLRRSLSTATVVISTVASLLLTGGTSSAQTQTELAGSAVSAPSGLLSQDDAKRYAVTQVSAVRKGPATNAAAANVITCTAYADRAHISSNTGRPNTHGWIDCSDYVYKIESRVFLNRDGNQVSSSALLQNYGRNHIEGTANAPSCTRGSYRGATTGYIIFPSGYSPATAQVYGLGQTATLC